MLPNVFLTKEALDNSDMPAPFFSWQCSTLRLCTIQRCKMCLDSMVGQTNPLPGRTECNTVLFQWKCRYRA
uniref:Uncharacterized protein n=1 Tax=Anguilla anguilla TaxID=7936 RepID=A0A0E9VW52_ANGAN